MYDCWLFHNVALYTGVFFFLNKAYICIHILKGSGFRKETCVGDGHSLYTGLCFDKGIPKNRAAAARGEDFVVSESRPP